MDRQAVAAIAALDDDVRRALYEHARAAGAPVTREAAAAAVGVSAKLAAFHLDRLVELGLLSAAADRPAQPRVGRAPKVYWPVAEDITVRVPARDPELLATILVEAVTTEREDERAADAVRRVARAHGVGLGTSARTGAGDRPAQTLAAGEELLAQHGFEPFREDGAVRLRNCPFHPVAGLAPELVCGLNHAYLAGLVEGLGAGEGVTATLAPRAGECCVELRAQG